MDVPILSNIILYFIKALGYHSFSFGIPEDCTGSNCSYYVGLNVNEENPNYLDIYLEGDAASWIAIGFSLDQYMVNIIISYIQFVVNIIV